MSLINDVLRDLDQRRNSPQSHVPPGVRPAPGADRAGPHARRVLFWSVVALLIGAAGYLTHMSLPRTPPEIATPQRPPAMPAAQEDASPARGADPDVPGLQQIAVHDAPGGVELRFLADSPVVHVLERSDDGNGVTLRLPVAGDDTDLPELLGHMPELSAVDWRVHDEHLTLDLRFREAPRLQARRLAAGVTLEFDFPDNDPDPEEARAEAASGDGGGASAEPREPAEAEQPEEADAAGPDAADSARLVEDPLGIPVAERDAAGGHGLMKSRAHSPDAAGALRRGRDAEEAGDTDRAMAIYRDALDAMPDAWRVRRALAARHEERGERAAAVEILARGLDYEAGADELARLKARLLREQDPERAIRVLEKHPAPMFGEGRWHALLAALYRQTGRAAEAVPLYRELAREQSSQGRWWLGLGVSLEESGEPARARAAYQRALAVGGLNSELTAFLRQRIESLE